MKRLLLIILAFLLIPFFACAATPPSTVPQGGTGWGTLQSGAVLLGNGTTKIATTTRGNLTGTGITVSGGSNAVLGLGTSLTLVTSGDWTGTFDGQEGTYYLDARNLTNFGVPFYSLLHATTTSALAEGSNLYWTNGRFDNRLSATTSLPNIVTLASLSLPYSQLTGAPTLFGYPFPSNATSTSVAFNGGLTGVLTGSLVGNASTATTLGANGTNCSAGNYPLGVDASGNSENCTAAGGGSSFTYPFPSNATSTLLSFTGGLLTHASTTINGRFELPALSAGGLGVDATGKVYSTATTTFSSGLTYSSGNVTNSGVTSLVAGTNIAISASTGAVTVTAIGYPFPGDATSTLLTLNGGLTLPTTAKLIAPYASTTAITATTASTTNLYVTGTGTSTVISGNVKIGGNLEVGGNILYTSAGELIAVAVAAAIVAIASATMTLTNKTITSPILTGAATVNAGTTFALAVPTSDGTATGDITSSFNAGYTTALGDLVYLDSSGTWQKADADASATTYSGWLGIALQGSITSGNPLQVLLKGYAYMSVAFPTFTIGGPVYMSATAGAMTQTAPTTTDSATRVLGFAVHADKMYFNPSGDYVTHA